jgi:hypothetical protein
MAATSNAANVEDVNSSGSDSELTKVKVSPPSPPAKTKPVKKSSRVVAPQPLVEEVAVEEVSTKAAPPAKADKKPKAEPLVIKSKAKQPSAPKQPKSKPNVSFNSRDDRNDRQDLDDDDKVEC